jgi:hypothetical protein
MSGFLVVEGERGMLCLGIKGLFLGEEGALGVASDVISFNCVPDIDSFVLCLDCVVCELGIRRVWRGFEEFRYRR